MELVSAIVTTHKREPEIVKRAVSSIIDQTYNNIEIIVVDDSPSDYESRYLVEEMLIGLNTTSSIQITYIKHDECLGACAARNTGFNHSNGTIIAYLDDDDEWLPTKLERMISGFSDEKVGLVYCNNEVFNTETNTKDIVYRTKYRGNVYNELIKGNFIGSTSFPLISRKALQDIGAFDLEMQSSQDYDVWLRISEKYQIEYINEVLVRYYVHGGEQITKNPYKKIAGLERLNMKNSSYLAQNAEAYWLRNMKIIPFYVLAGDKKKALKTWLSCVRKCPTKLSGNIKYMTKII